MTVAVFYVSIAGFISGVGLASLWPLSAAYAGLFLILSCSVLACYFLSGVSKKRILLASLFLLALAGGIFRFEVSKTGLTDQFLESNLDRQVILSGLVIGEPDIREREARLTVRLEQIQIGSEQIPVIAKALVGTEIYPRFDYGDRVIIRGKLRHPEEFDTATGRKFNYPAYLAKDGIGYQMSFAKVSLIETLQGNPILSKLFGIKNSLERGMSLVLPEPHSSLLAGLLLGVKQSLGQILLDDFRIVGLIHLVVLSGYNLTIVGEFARWLFSWLSRVPNFIFATLAIIAFALMTGAGATVVRAAIMASLALLARASGRTYEMTRALLVAGALMVFHNPKILVFDPSFQLSFLATVGLIFVSPILLEKLFWIPERGNLREVVSATIATQIMVLPFLLYATGAISTIALASNILVLGIVPQTMLFGFLAALIAILSPLFALPLAAIAYGLLSYILSVTTWFAGLPFASVEVPWVSGWLAFLLYALLSLALVRYYRLHHFV